MTFDLGRWLPEFPIRENCLYLDHAAVCPLPKSTAQAMRNRVEAQEQGGRRAEADWKNSTLSCRHLGAQLMGCDPEDVSLIRSTSEGLSIIAEGLDWQPGDEVLVGAEEFASNAAPWLNLAHRGVEIRRFPQLNGRIDPHDVKHHLTPRTRVLAVSWVSFHTGWIAPLAALKSLCRETGTALVVDAIQGLGAACLHMRSLGLDAVVADSHKWLLGPEGIGVMGTSPRFRAALRPVLTGWRSVRRRPGSMFLRDLEPLEDGRRFEPGATNSVGIAGLAASLDLLTTVGMDVVTQRVETLNRLLTRILIAHGWEVASPGSGHPALGIVAAKPPAGSAREAVARLEERHVLASAREQLVRFSPHWYTTRGEIEALDRILTKCGL